VCTLGVFIHHGFFRPLYMYIIFDIHVKCALEADIQVNTSSVHH